MSKAVDSLVNSIRTLDGKARDALNLRAVQCYRLATEHDLKGKAISDAANVPGLTPALAGQSVKAVTRARVVGAFPITTLKGIPTDALALIDATRTNLVLTEAEFATVLGPYEGTGDFTGAAEAVKVAGKAKRDNKAKKDETPDAPSNDTTARVLAATTPTESDALSTFREALKAADVALATLAGSPSVDYVEALKALERFNRTHVTPKALKARDRVLAGQ